MYGIVVDFEASECISESLDADTDGSVFEIGTLSRFSRIEVSIDDVVEVNDDSFYSLFEGVKVK